MAAAPLVCPDQTRDPVSYTNLSGSTDPTVVKLSVGHGHIECYEFESIYGMLKRAIISFDPHNGHANIVFRSPLTRNPYTAADRAEIERIRSIYVAANPREAAKFPSLENLPPGETTIKDAQDAIRGIAENVPGSEERLERILARGIIDNSSTNNERETLLFTAIVYKLPALIKRFKPNGDFVTKGRNYTPFLLACEQRDFSIIKMVAPDPEDKEAVNALLGSEAAPAPVVVAAEYKKTNESIPEILEWLFDTYKYDVDCTDAHGNTPLTIAVSNENIPVVLYLLDKKGANINVLTKVYESALKIAADNGDVEMVKILLAHGAKMFINDKDGSSAVSVAQTKKASSRYNGQRASFNAILRLLEPVPAEHIEGVDKPNNFVQRPGDIAARAAAIAAAQRRGAAAVEAAAAAEQAEAAAAAAVAEAKAAKLAKAAASSAAAVKASAAAAAASAAVAAAKAAKTASGAVAAAAGPRQSVAASSRLPAAAAAAPRQSVAAAAASRQAAPGPGTRFAAGPAAAPRQQAAAAAAPVISIRERQRQQEEQAAARRAAAAARSGQTVAVKTVQVGFGSTRRRSRRNTRRPSRHPSRRNTRRHSRRPSRRSRRNSRRPSRRSSGRR